jgi:hypothetical protein
MPARDRSVQVLACAVPILFFAVVCGRSTPASRRASAASIATDTAPLAAIRSSNTARCKRLYIRQSRCGRTGESSGASLPVAANTKSAAAFDRMLPDPLAGRTWGEPIEAEAHVDRLSAQKDSDGGGDHRVCKDRQ